MLSLYVLFLMKQGFSAAWMSGKSQVALRIKNSGTHKVGENNSNIFYI